MTVFSKPGRSTSLRYVRVTFPGFEEQGEVSGVASCRVQENSESTLKVSGSLSFHGATGLDGMDDMVRVYSTSTAAGEVEEVCHGTFMVSMPARTLSETGETGDADLYSTLKALQDKLTGDATVLAAGASPLALAVSLAAGCGLHVVADSSDFKAGSDHTWDAGTDALSIVNDCLGFCGFSSATVDGYGNVVMRRYRDPSERPVAATLSDTGRGDGYIIGARAIKNERDAASVPNVSYVTVTRPEGDPLTGRAENSDPASPFSTASRGREISTRAEYQELAGDPNAKALELLKSAMRVTDKYEVETLYYGIGIGDVARIDYAGLGVGVQASLVSRDTEMTHQLKCSCTFRRTVDYFQARTGA